MRCWTVCPSAPRGIPTARLQGTDFSYEVMSVDTKGGQNPRSNVFPVNIL